MLDTYDKMTQEKDEIERMVYLINENNIFSTETLKNKLKAIIKNILFIKQMLEFKGESHYSKSMISDLLLLMNSLTKNSTKMFYILYRSFIENFVRFTLELEDTDNTGVRALFTEFKNEYSTLETKELIDFIEGEYGKGCDFIHSSINANQNIYEYYKELIDEDAFKIRDIDRLSSIIFTFLKKSTLLLVIMRPEWIDQAFYRRKQLLTYLVGIEISDNLKVKINDI